MSARRLERGEMCRGCSMFIEPGEYHPWAACLMYKGCNDSVQVRIGLQRVIDYGRSLEAQSKAAALAAEEAEDG